MSFFSVIPQPCIVFCGHPSLRFGDAVHFIDMWGSSPQNAILFTGMFSYFLIVGNNDSVYVKPKCNLLKHLYINQ